MGRYATRSAFVAALCAGVAMVGASVNGLLDVDAELQRSAMAAQNQSLEYRSVRVTAPLQRGWDCPDQGAEPRSKQRV